MLGELPQGWATAAALHCLDETDDPSLGVCEWYHAFRLTLTLTLTLALALTIALTLTLTLTRYHAFCKSAACRRSGLAPAELLAHFVIALNSLQALGFAAASKRQRGMLQKMAYSEEGLLAPPR